MRRSFGQNEQLPRHGWGRVRTETVATPERVLDGFTLIVDLSVEMTSSGMSSSLSSIKAKTWRRCLLPMEDSSGVPLLAFAIIADSLRSPMACLSWMADISVRIMPFAFSTSMRRSISSGWITWLVLSGSGINRVFLVWISIILRCCAYCRIFELRAQGSVRRRLEKHTFDGGPSGLHEPWVLFSLWQRCVDFFLKSGKFSPSRKPRSGFRV